jgi:aminopeptidase YwaD
MLTGFTWGSDHAIFNDASIHVPALLVNQWPDRYYHSSDDTPDKSCVESFEWVGRGVLDTLVDLASGIPDERAAVVAAHIRSQGLADSVRYSDPLIRDWVARRTRAALLALQETADTPVVRAELAATGTTAPMPEFQSKVPIIGPIEEVWMSPDDLQWNDRLMRDFPCWYNLKAEVINFIQLGIEREDALKLATAEFDAPAPAIHAARHYLELLTTKGYLLP